MDKVQILRVPVDPTASAELMEIEPSVDELRRVIDDGWLEGIYSAGWHAYLDAEGKLKSLPANLNATALANRLGWLHADILCGTVVFLGNHRRGAEADVPMSVLTAARELRILA